MATYYNPKIITNNIEFSVDAANVKSWNGPSPLGTDYGYFGGGITNDPYGRSSSVERIDYNNDTATAALKGPLTWATWKTAGVSSINYGYIVGGHPSDSTQTDRIDYSSDTSTAVTKGPMNFTRYLATGAGNKDYGYIAGGYPANQTIISRIDYSNDTATAAAKGPLSAGRYHMGGAGNQSYGWYAGGSPEPAGVTKVDRLDYSSDTSTTSPKGPLSKARYSIAGTGNASYGYFGGGSDGTPGTPHVSTVDRIDYSSDTGTTPAKGPLSEAKYYVAATGNTSYGYFAGGAAPGPNRSTVDRIDYSSDTGTAPTKGPLNLGRYGAGPVSPRQNANPTSQSVWKDMTGHGNLTVDGPTFSGLNGGVWDFDGSNDYMEKTSFSGVAFGTGDFAVETWVRVDNLTANHMIFESRSGISATEDGFLFLAFGSNNDEWAVWTAGAAKISGANGSVAADTWYHTIVTRISGTTTLYVNGVSIGSFSDSYNYSNDDLRIGKNVSSADYLNGKIALYRIYKARGFTASEVLNNFNATRTRFGV